MSGVQVLFATSMKLQVVRLGTVKIYFLKKKRILNTVLAVEDLLISKLDFFVSEEYLLSNAIFIFDPISFINGTVTALPACLYN